MNAQPHAVDKNEPTKFVISYTETPVIRAGVANILIYVAFNYVILVYVAFRHVLGSTFLSYSLITFFGLAGTLLFLKHYASHISKLEMQQKELKIFCSLSTFVIRYQDIDYVKISFDPLVKLTKIKIKEKTSSSCRTFRLPTPFVKNEVIFNVVPKLKQTFAAHGVSVK